MGKTYVPGQLVELPRTSALDLEALSTAILTEAAAQAAFPPGATRSRDRLEGAVSALSAGIAGVVTPQAAKEGPLAHEVDPRLDKVLSAARSITEAVLAVDEPENTLRPHAKAIHDVFFADGLGYVNFPYKRQWSAVKARLTVADEAGLAARFEALGAPFLLAALRRLHAEYGAALGITDAKQAVDVEAKLAPLADAVREELRRYVEKVVASVEPDEPATAEVAAALLRPLAEHDVTPAKAPAPQPDREPEPTPA